MNMYVGMMLVAVVFLALQFSTNRAYGLKCGTGAESSLTFACLSDAISTGICILIAFLFEGSLTFPIYSLLLAGIIAVLCLAYKIIGFKIMALGNLSVFTMFLMLGGMMLPYLFGVIFLDERISACRIIGIVLLSFSMIFPVLAHKKDGKNNKRKDNLVFFLLCTVVFCLNGGVSIISKIHQISSNTHITCSPANFSALSNFISMLVSRISLTMVKKQKKKAESISGKTTISLFACVKKSFILYIVIGQAAFGCISYVLQLIAASHVEASMLYPMLTGGSIVLSAVAGYIFFKERPDKLSLIGLCISFAATFLFLF